MDTHGFAVSTFPRKPENLDELRRMALRQTPMIEATYPGYVLIFRTPEGYEAFNAHASLISTIADFPFLTYYDTTREDIHGWLLFHPKAAERVISALIKAGHKVAVCERYGS